MEIQGAGISAGYYTKPAAISKEEVTVKTDQETLAAQEQQKKAAADRFEKTKETADVTYNVPKKLTAEARKGIDEQRAASYQNMLVSMLGKQGEAYQNSLGKQFGMGETDWSTQSADSISAAASIAPGGMYSVDAVATRIVDMAKSLSGGDPSKIALLRDAVKKGFEAAGVEMGGKLPDISHDTYSEVMKRFDDWENEGKTVIEEL